MHFEVGRHLAPEQLAELEGRIRLVLGDVQAAVRDFDALQARVPDDDRGGPDRHGARYALDEIEEARALPRVAARRQLRLPRLPRVRVRGRASCRSCRESRLGILPGRHPLALLDARPRRAPSSRRCASACKAATSSSSRRRTDSRPSTGARRWTTSRSSASMRRGNTVALHRLLGLFTRKAYMEPAEQDADPRPQAPPDRRRRGLPRGLARLQDARRALRVLPQGRAVRRRPGRAASDARPRCSISRSGEDIQLFIRPRSRRGAGLGARRPAARPLQRRAAPAAPGAVSRALPRLVDRLPPLARRRAAGADPLHGPRRRRDPGGLVRRARAGGRRRSRGPGTTASANDSSRSTGRNAATRSPTSTSSDFPDYYKASTDVYLALLDIEQFERLEDGEPFAVGLQNERGQEQNLTRIGLYKTAGKVRLSDFLPDPRAPRARRSSRRFRPG